MPFATISAWDISSGALEIAASNATTHNVDVKFLQQDIFQPFPSGMKYNLIVSNPPYILESEKESIEENVLRFEPHEALFVPDKQPLMFYERIADVANTLLKEEGQLFFEINRGTGGPMAGMLQDKGFTGIELRRDISGNWRMIKAKAGARK